MDKKIFGLQKNVFFLGLTSFFNDFSSEMILSILPAFFISVLKSGAQSLGLVEGLAEAFSNIMKIYSGRLSDKIHRKKIFAVIGYSLSVITRPFYSFVSTVGNVIGLRVTDRVGKGLRDAPRDALISASVDKAEMSKSFGYHRAMDTLGAIFGPLVAYFILLRNPNAFNSVFMTAFVIGILAIFSLVLVSDVKTFIESKKTLEKTKYTFSFSYKLYLFSIFVLSLGSLPVAVLLFKTKDLGFVIASIPLFYMVYNISYAIFSLPAGKIADKIGNSKVIFVGYIMLILGYIVLIYSHTAYVLIFGFLLLGINMALTDGTQRAQVSKLVEEDFKGEAYGYFNAVVGLGALLSGIVGGFLWQNYGDNFTLIVGSVVVLFGLILFGFTIKKKTKKQVNPFEDIEVAEQWINSVENEKGMIRDKEIYPILKRWAELVNPKTVLDIGAGQGVCADYVQVNGNKYIGVEPSPILVKRAKELYSKLNREFFIGDAYELPLASKSVDAAFSVNVWFHLENLNLASKELSRILKNSSKFLIITANPNTYDIWRSMYFDAVEDDKKIDGKVNVPINPMSRNIFYKHDLDEIKKYLIDNDLIIDKIEEFGFISSFTTRPIFISITGYKK